VAVHNAPHRALRVGCLIDGTGAAPRRGVTIVLAGDRIEGVRSSASGSAALGDLWDLSGYTALPGLIDAHVHVFGSGDPREPNWFVREVTELVPTVAFNCLLNAQRNLAHGFTTIRDLACRHYADVALRNAIEAGRLEGPRMKVCGVGLTSTAGHMDRAKGFAPGVVVPGPSAIVDGPDEGRRAVRANLRYGADFIKINATLSELVRPLDGLCSPEMTRETMAAICETAHAHGRKVAAHCHGGVGVTWALEAGVDVLEHGRFLADDQLDTMAAKGVFLCPTLSPEAKARDLGLVPPDPHLARWQERARDAMYETVRRARRAGVTIVNGSDAAMPGVRHGEGGAYEMAQLVAAGLSPMEAVIAATSAAARCLGMEGEIGTVEAGKLADLILVDGDPLDGIELLQDLERVPVVIKGGRIVANRLPAAEAASLPAAFGQSR
jgi:imidazolonepropionase-like amidohydrolase